MTSGYHSHFCPKCDKRYECTQITHCQRPDTALCPEHVNEEVNRIIGPELDRLKVLNAAFNRMFGK